MYDCWCKNERGKEFGLRTKQVAAAAAAAALFFQFFLYCGVGVAAGEKKNFNRGNLCFWNPVVTAGQVQKSKGPASQPALRLIK